MTDAVKIVPCEPTEEMKDAGVKAAVMASPEPWFPATYAAAIAAAPSSDYVAVRREDAQHLLEMAIEAMTVCGHEAGSAQEAATIRLRKALEGRG